jgi:hypothetical protein
MIFDVRSEIKINYQSTIAASLNLHEKQSRRKKTTYFATHRSATSSSQKLLNREYENNTIDYDLIS